ncbi:DUF6236 family protein [Sphingomonas olei]
MTGKPWGFEFNGDKPAVFSLPRQGLDGRPLGRQVNLSPPLAKGERGGVLTPPVNVKSSSKAALEVETPRPLSEELLKLTLLFVDRIDVPKNRNISSGNANIDALSDMGIASRSTIFFEGGVGLDKMFTHPWLAYLELEKREPGRWSIWQEPNQQIVPEDELTPDLAFQLELTNGLIVPHELTPYEDVLSFKDRHRDELISLRHHLEDFAIRLSKEGDPRAVNLERERFDVSLADYLKKARRSNVRKAIASVTTEFDWKAGVSSIAGGGSGGLLAAAQNLSLTAAATAIGGGVLAALSLKSVAGLKDGPSPFRYIARIEKEYGG